MFEDSLDSESKKREAAASKGAAHLEVINPNTILNGILQEDPDKPIPYYSNTDHPASFNLAKVVSDPTKAVDAQIMECDRDGRYRLQSYDKHGLYARLNSARVIESAPERKLELREAIQMRYGNLMEQEVFPSDSDRSSSLEPFSNFTPLFMGPYYRNQFMYKMLELKSKCYEAYNNNPIGHRIPNLITQFTLGKGVTAVCKNDKTIKVWNDFAKLNKIGTAINTGISRAGARLRMWSNQLSVDGEMMWQFVPSKAGLLCKYLDSATILDVITDPEDIDKPYYFHQQLNTAMQTFTKDGIPGMKYIIRDIPAQDVLHIKINVYENEKRGRSDLASIIGYLKRMKDLVNANIIKAYFQACQTFDYEIDGSKELVQQIANAYKGVIPTPGASYFHNKNIKRTPQPPLGAAGAGNDSDMMGLMNLIAMGPGISPVYLIGAMAANRAGVLAETEPSSKMFFERQTVWDETLHAMFEYLARWHYKQTGEMLDDNIEFSFPQVVAVERNAYLQSLDGMVASKRFTKKRAAELAAKEFSVTNYSFDQESKDIVQESKDELQKELDLNKVKSAAQSHLSMWQSILADTTAQQTQETLGPDSLLNQPAGPEEDPMHPASPAGQAVTAAQQAQQPQGGAKSNGKPKTPAGRSGAKSPAKPAKRPAKAQLTRNTAPTGGITDKERSDTAKRVKSNPHG